MTMRVRLLLAFLLAGCAGADMGTKPFAPGGEAVAVTVSPVALRSADETDRTLGKLVYRGGISISPDDSRLGGLSAFKVSADGTRFASVEDMGVWVTGALTYDAAGDLTGAGDVKIARMLGATGEALEGKTEGDSEGLAFADPHDLKGDAFVSLERDHRVLRFDFAKDGMVAHGQLVPMPAAVKTLRNNEGLEALATLADGRLLAISEYGVANDDADSVGWVVNPQTGESISFTVKRNLPFAMTDATLLPDGRVITLERSFDVLSGPGAEMRIFNPADFKDGAMVSGEVIATLSGGVTVDNMEGIAARKAADGKTFVYIVSDDNFQRPLQRTLIMMFELVE
jgi:hypothetical protein